jgi:hypothetical protein
MYKSAWTEAFELECQDKILKVVMAPQASAEKKRAFSQLLSLVLAHIDRFSSRSWLPEDEAASVALSVVARLERENYKNLAEFTRRAAEERAAGRRPSFEGWLRKLSKWEILNRLNKLSVSGLLPNDERGAEIIDNKAASQSLPLEKLIRMQRQKLEHRLLEEAVKHLDDRQRTAVVLYWEGKSNQTEDGKRREQTRALYEDIKTRLGLDSAVAAKELVRGARQKLDFWLERLMQSEAR